MMREIKFRGKQIDNGELVFGSHRLFKNGTGNRHFIIDYDEQINGGIEYEVDPDTVGQYTGLKDKNGREIYEGDIVTGLFDHTDIIGHIIYGSDATFFIYRKGLYGIGLNNAEDWLEVIGNIHENPELLEAI
jgi:uncharacterized phage protein (TIGR01671 family)